MRFVCPVIANIFAMLIVATVSPAQPAGSSLSVDSNYTYVGTARYTRTQWYVTYKAELVNAGSAAPDVVGTVRSLAPNVVIVPGQDTIHFGSVPANATVTSTDAFTIIVDPSVAFSWSQIEVVLQSPKANAGPDQTVTVGSTVHLDGSKSANAAGTGGLTYSWSFASTPAGSKASLSATTAATPSFVADVAGSYVLNLTVNNGSASDTASTTIATTNSLPVANAGPNMTVSSGATVTLDGSKSYDVDGNALTYQWTMISVPQNSYASFGSTYASVMPSFMVDVPGTYVAELIVTDTNGSSAPSTVTISTTNTPPVADAGPNQLVKVGSTVQLTAAASTDVNGNPLTYKWSLLSAPAQSTATISDASSVTPAFVADVAGTYVAQLIVNDGTVDSAPSTVTITTNGLLPPAANAGSDQVTPVGSTATLAGSGTDPQGFALTYHWALLSRPSGSITTLQGANTASPTLYIDFPGTYVAQLITNDGQQNSTPSTVVVTTGTAAPTAVAGPSQNVPAGSQVTLNGSNSFDPGHNQLTYFWALLHVPQGSSATLSSSTTASPTFIADVAGIYIAQLIVNNGSISSPPTTVAINASQMQISLTPVPLNILLNASGTLSVNITPAAGPNGVAVNLMFDPSIVQMPSTVNIAPNATSATVQVTPKAIGSSSVLATASGYLAGTGTINVGTASISLSLPAGVGVGHSISGTVTLSAPAPGSDTVVTLQSSSDATATVIPTTVTIAAGKTSGTFTLTGVAAGSVTLTASSPGYTNGTAAVLVSTLGAIGLAPNVTVAPGQSAPIAVTLSAPAPAGGETITLSSSDTTRVTVTNSVSIAAGATTPAVQPQVMGVAFGSATITATGPGYVTATQTVQVSAALSFSPQNPTIGLNGTQNLTLSISTAPATAVVVNLSSSNTSVATVPLSVTIQPNTTSVTVPVTGKGIGSAKIAASTSNPNITGASVSVSVASFGGITVVPTLSVALGQSVPFTVSLSSPAPQNGVTITLSSSDATKVSLNEGSVFIAGGQTTPATQPQVSGVAPGSAVVTASANGYVSSSSTVTTTAGLSLSPTGITINGTASQNATVTLSAPAPSGGLVVNLSATPSGIVSFTTPVTIAANTTSATFSLTGVSEGTTTLTATAAIPNVTSATDKVTVLSSQAIILSSGVSVAPNQSAAFDVTLPIAAPSTGVTVSLSSSDTTKVTISPSTVFIAGGQTQPATQPQVKGVDFGSAVITASAPGYVNGTQSVKVAAALSFNQSTLTITGPATQNLTLTLSAPAPAPITVNLSTSLGGIVTVPASVTIPQNGTSATVPVTGLSIGTTNLSASTTFGNISGATTAVTVQTGGTISIPSNLSVALGQSMSLQVSLSQPAPSSGLKITLASSAPGVLSVSPTTVTIAAGATQPAVLPTITGVAPGSAVVTASAATYTSATQTIKTTATIALTPQSPSVTIGQNQNLTLTLSGPAPSSGLTFNVASSDSTVAKVPATVTFASGAATATISVTGVAAGSAVITVSGSNVTSATDTVTVTPALGIILPSNLTVGPGASMTFPVSLTSAPQTPVTVTLSLSNGNASLNFTSVSFNAGSVTPTRQPVITGNTTGTVTVTATAPGYSTATSAVTIGLSATLTPNPLTVIGTTGSGTLFINLSSLTPSPITFTLTSSNTNVATVPGIVRLPANSQNVGFAVNPVALGTTTITATAPGFPAITATVNVASTPPLTLSANSTSLQIGGTATLTVSLPSASQNGSVTVNLSSSSSAVSITPASVIIPQGSTTGTAMLTALNVGSASISASAASYGAPAPVAVQVSATVSFSSPTLTITGAGNQGMLTLVLSGPVPPGSSGVAITLSSTTPAVATVPATVKFPVNTAAHPTIQIPVTAIGVGTTTIHASGTNVPDTTATVTVLGPLAITTSSLPNGSVGVAYTASITVSGGVGALKYSATGLPANLTINSATGQITGVPQSSGTSTVDVTVSDSNTPTPNVAHATFTLQVTQGVPASLVATGGTPQSAQAGTQFSSPLSATVKDSSGNLLSGISVTFTAPASGASGTFAGGGATVTVTTNSSGVATSTAFTANSSVGAYSVLATVNGVATPATFALTNTNRGTPSISVVSGTPQTVQVNAAFANLVVQVKDSLGNPVSGVAVTFAAPGSGASGTFAGGTTSSTVNTDGTGKASVAFTANKIAGSFTVSATAPNTNGSAAFSLTNAPGAVSAIVATGGTPQNAAVSTAFALPLAATVSDGFGNPLSNVTVTFTAVPASNGASGKFANSSAHNDRDYECVRRCNLEHVYRK